MRQCAGQGRKKDAKKRSRERPPNELSDLAMTGVPTLHFRRVQATPQLLHPAIFSGALQARVMPWAHEVRVLAKK